MIRWLLEGERGHLGECKQASRQCILGCHYVNTRRYSARCCGDCEKLKMKLSRDDMDSLCIKRLKDSGMTCLLVKDDVDS